MTERKYTPEGLPIISKDSVERYILENHVEGTYRETLPKPNIGDILLKENPKLYDYVCQLKIFHENRGETEIARSIVTGVGIAYMLLRSRGEANKLEENSEDK